MSKHLQQMSADELADVYCEYCPLDDQNTLDMYGCPNCLKDNERICCVCCGCFAMEDGEQV